MPLREEPFEDPIAFADADKSLRAASRLFAKDLALMATPRIEDISRLDWSDTQVVARERRLDRSLNIDLGNNERIVLHFEWVLRLTERSRERAAQYHLESAFTARSDARTMRRVHRTMRHVFVKSVIVVLTGRKKRWPRYGKYQTSPPGKRFTGVRFRIVAVYQHTVEQLKRKGSLFWLAFVPLAKDADAEKLGQTVKSIGEGATWEVFVEVISTMLSMAQLRNDRPEFMDVIRQAARKENAMRHPWYQDGHADGFAKGKLEGKLEGKREGKREGLATLVFLFERRLGRTLRAREQERLAKRLTHDGPEKLGTVVLDYSPEELAAWLAPRKTGVVQTNSPKNTKEPRRGL